MTTQADPATKEALRRSNLKSQIVTSRSHRARRRSVKRGIIETWGRGTLKIGRLMRDAGLKPPTVTLRPGTVVVTFGLPGVATGKTPLKTPLKTAEAILAVLGEEPHLSLPTIAKRLRKSGSAVKRAIRRLREDGRLERVGPDKGGYWKVIE